VFETMKKTALEVIQSMSPIIVVIVILQFTVIHAPVDVFLRFLIGAAMTVFGASFFLLGVRTGILPIGRDIGAEIPQHGSVILIIFVGLVFGFAVTAAEPGVLVLQSMAVEAGINNSDALVFVVATGMALLFTSALIRILFGFSFFSSKHLRFLRPDICPVFDSIISDNSGYLFDEFGYELFAENCLEIGDHLEELKIKNPRKRPDDKWYTADVEVAIWKYLK
jgi:hypothetical protein